MHVVQVLGLVKHVLSLDVNHGEQNDGAVQKAIQDDDYVFCENAVQYQTHVAEDGEEKRDRHVEDLAVVAPQIAGIHFFRLLDVADDGKHHADQTQHRNERICRRRNIVLLRRFRVQVVVEAHPHSLAAGSFSAAIFIYAFACKQPVKSHAKNTAARTRACVFCVPILRAYLLPPTRQHKHRNDVARSSSVY